MSEAHTVPPIDRRLVVVALMLGMFTSALEVTVVGTAMPTAVGDLGGIELYAWVFSASLLATSLAGPIAGRLADRHGRRPLYLWGGATFFVGTLACGLAPSMRWLIAFRVIQGAGAGALAPIGITIIGDIFPLAERGRVQGYFAAVWAVSGLLGPTLGGLVVKALSWRWVFFAVLPVTVLSMGLLAWSFRDPPEARGSGPLRFDFFATRFRSFANLGNALIGALLMAEVTYLPLYVQGVRLGTPVQAGAALTPMMVAWPLASVVAGRLVVRVGFSALLRWGFVGSAVAAAGGAIVVLSGASLMWLRPVMVVLGFGLGLASLPLILAVQTSVNWDSRGGVTADAMVFRNAGGAVALGALGAVLAAVLRAHPEVPPRVAEDLLGPLRGRGLGAGDVAAVSHVLATGLGRVFAGVALLGLVAAVVGLVFPPVPSVGGPSKPST